MTFPAYSIYPLKTKLETGECFYSGTKFLILIWKLPLCLSFIEENLGRRVQGCVQGARRRLDFLKTTPGLLLRVGLFHVVSGWPDPTARLLFEACSCALHKGTLPSVLLAEDCVSFSQIRTTVLGRSLRSGDREASCMENGLFWDKGSCVCLGLAGNPLHHDNISSLNVSNCWPPRHLWKRLFPR